MSTAFAGGIFAPVLYMLGHVPAAELLAFAAGCLAGLIITPDLDIRHFTHAEQIVRRSGGRAGNFLAGLWLALWWPYSHLVPYHRHALSHMPVLGTALRVLYLSVILALLYGAAGRLTALPPLFPALSMLLTPYLGWGLVGSGGDGCIAFPAGCDVSRK